MMKSVAPCVALCLLLAGCAVCRRSDTWARVTEVRRNACCQADYLPAVHRELSARGVPHKMVTYNYPFSDRRHVRVDGTCTAIVYRDEIDPAHPWWLTDERMTMPVWLPNGDLGEQVTFYARGPAEIVTVKHFGSDGKSSIAADSRQLREDRTMVTARSSMFRIGERRSVARVDGSDAAHHAPAFRNGQPTLRRAQVAAPKPDSADEKMFRRRHGTPFDRASMIDRAKLEALKERFTKN